MAAIRRSIKNALHKYEPCERDVREVTSNDASRPAPTIRARIADATFDLCVDCSRLV